MAEQLDLRPEPRSPAMARRWVRDRLTGIGRDDLVDAATLGVSELVTNALLHAGTPIVVSIRAHGEQLRIGVFDEAPLRRTAPPAGPQVLATSTVGRGLHILEEHASAWGVSAQGHGKVVWFEPAPSPDVGPAGLSPADLPPVLETAPAAAVRVCLFGVPVAAFLAFQAHLLELVREMQLVAFDDGSQLSDWAEHVAGLVPRQATFARLMVAARRMTLRSRGSVVWRLRQAM
ncbi:MAG: ATP-binding protein [Actinomycetota bacterium]|nr:ATP-binding protein [Actinomycetota bacterium]